MKACSSTIFKSSKDVHFNPFQTLSRSSSFSTETHFTNQIQSNSKAFFKSENSDLIVKRLCNDNKFSEAIHILCEKNRLGEAIQLLNRIERPSAAIYSNLLQLCLQQRAVDLGKKVHVHAQTAGFKPGIIIYNRLLDMYCKCGSVVDAQKVFDEMTQRDVCSWNIMISGYAKAGELGGARGLFDKMPEKDNFSWNAMVSGYVRHNQPSDALDLFRVMQKDYKLKSTKFIVSSALSACSSIRSLHGGKEIHGHIVRTGLDSDEVVWSSLFRKIVLTLK